MLIAGRIRNKALKRYWEHGDSSGINASWRGKVGRILNALDIAESPQELDVPGFGFHELKGDRKGIFSVWISRNWRLTFQWTRDGPADVDMEDYHGR